MSYPDPICQDCGKKCEKNEEVLTLWPDGIELWCYCPRCDIETFHVIPKGEAFNKPEAFHNQNRQGHS